MRSGVKFWLVSETGYVVVLVTENESESAQMPAGMRCSSTQQNNTIKKKYIYIIT